MREQAGAAARIDFPQRGGVAVDAMEQSAAVQTLALLMARCLTQEELSRAALLLTQLGTTLGTIAALGELETASSE